MGSDHGGDPAVQRMGEGHFFRGGFGMDVDQRGMDVAAKPVAGEQIFHGAERVIQRVHEQPAHGLGDEHPAAVLQGDHGSPGARGAGREVQRSQQPRLARDIGDDFLAVPGMVAERDGVGSGREQGVSHFRRQPEAVGGVFRIHGDEIGPALQAQPRQGGQHGIAPGTADEVAQHQQPQGKAFLIPGLYGYRARYNRRRRAV
jgi:hypothetical protein